mmetsp:Transcript_20056/g.65997  ORF Transcript_20056/g.65997 Transcript_20056/m.65997 type:complete len:495 (+) Transcript_20056:103-1587(+)
MWRARCGRAGSRLVAVRVGLEGALLGHADVVGLLVGEDREVDAERREVERGDLLVEDLGQRVDLADLVLARVLLLPELELGERLVREGVGHDERRVAGRAAEVEEAALGEEDGALAVLEEELVDLGLDVDARRHLHEAVHVDLVVEVADVADDRVVAHLLHVLGHDDALVARRRDDDVEALELGLEGLDREALHGRLERADGVALGDRRDAARGLHREGAALADVAVAADDGALARHHDVRRAADAVDDGVLAAVEVVELGLGDRVVDVDGREEELAVLGHGVEAVDARRRLLGDALHARGDLVPLVGLRRERALDDREHDLELRVVRGRRVGERAVLGVGVLRLEALVDEERHVAAVVDDEVRAVALGVRRRPRDRVHRALPVLLEGLALPGEDGGGLVAGDGRRGVVLRREDVARAPADVAAELLERLDEHGRLDRHVERAGDARALEGLRRAVLLDRLHEAGHLILGELDLPATEVGERDVGDAVVSLGHD